MRLYLNVPDVTVVLVTVPPLVFLSENVTGTVLPPIVPAPSTLTKYNVLLIITGTTVLYILGIEVDILDPCCVYVLITHEIRLEPTVFSI